MSEKDFSQDVTMTEHEPQTLSKCELLILLVTYAISFMILPSIRTTAGVIALEKSLLLLIFSASACSLTADIKLTRSAPFNWPRDEFHTYLHPKGT